MPLQTFPSNASVYLEAGKDVECIGLAVFAIHVWEWRATFNIIADFLAPNPFISTGKPGRKQKRDKIARFTHNFVICVRVPSGLMGPTGQGIIKIGSFFRKSLIRVEINPMG